jgi:hypothetical protein
VSDCGVCLSAGFDFGDNNFSCWMEAFKTPMICCECGRCIPAGEVHEKARFREEGYGSDRGKWVTHHTCSVCAEIAWAFFCDSRLYECLWDSITDDLLPDFTQACLNKLKTVAAKAEMQRRWIEWKFAA